MTQAMQSAIALTSESTPVPVDARRNIFAFMTDIMAFMVGTYFVPSTTVLVGLASQLTEDKALIGAVGMTWAVSWFLPQLVAARVVRGKRYQKPYLIIPSLFGRNAFLLLALWLMITGAQPPLLTVWMLIGAVAAFNVCDALAGVAWFDMLSRALSPRIRARVVSVGQILGGVLGIGAGVAVERILAPETGLPFPQNYALVFTCTWVFMVISLVAAMLIREIPMDPTEQQQAQHVAFLSSLRQALRGDKTFVRVLTLRLLTGIELMAASFYLVFAREVLQLGEGVTGQFNMALIVGGLAGIALFGWLADRFTALSVVRAAALMQAIAPATALLFVLLSAEAPRALALASFFLIFALRGAIEHSLVLGVVSYLMDSAPQRHRAMYVGALNTVSGIVALSPLLGGLWLDSFIAAGQRALGYGSMFAAVAALAFAGFGLSLKLPRLAINIESFRQEMKAAA
ncbi:MAG: PucC family protein [Anaerolineae bacterium]|nr:PucC family protein [Thermoflexales bacterium]MDW8054240.1 PucC family protein [Anaerolineae bacterium]